MAAADTTTDIDIDIPTDPGDEPRRAKIKPGPKVSARQLQARARVQAYKKANPKKRGPKPGTKYRKRPAILPLATTDAPPGSPGSPLDTPAEYAALAIKPSQRHHGRPSLCTPEVFAEICDRMAGGEFLTRICEESQFPSYYSILRYLEANPASRTVYNQIRRSQAQWWVEKGALLVAEATDPRVSNLLRVKVDTFKYLAAKIDPDNWADKTGSGANVTVNILTQERAGTARKVLLADLDALASGKHIIDVDPEAPAFEG